MISETAAWTFDKLHCRPLKRSHTSIGGPTIPLKQPKSNRGKKWTWPGSSPHPTRMHAYASLTSDQKDAWKAMADSMSNGHSTATPAPYSGAIAYMISNLSLRLAGNPYTDDAPAGDQPGTEFTGQITINPSTPRQFDATLTNS